MCKFPSDSQGSGIMQGYANSVTIILTKFWQETEIQCQRKKQNPTKILATSQTLSYQILVK